MVGYKPPDKRRCADWIHRVLVESEAPEQVGDEVWAFREDFQTVYYCFENGFPPNAAADLRN